MASSAQLASVIAAASGSKASFDQLMENLQRHQKLLQQQSLNASSPSQTQTSQPLMISTTTSGVGNSDNTNSSKDSIEQTIDEDKNKGLDLMALQKQIASSSDPAAAATALIAAAHQKLKDQQVQEQPENQKNSMMTLKKYI